MDLKFKVIGFKECYGKEDNTYYCPLNIKELMNGHIVYDNKHKIKSTFNSYDTILVDSDILLVDDNCLTLDDVNCVDNNISHDTPYFNGLIQAGFICVTNDGAIFKNIYLTRLNKLGIITHHRVRANFIIKKHIKDNVYDVML